MSMESDFSDSTEVVNDLIDDDYYYQGGSDVEDEVIVQDNPGRPEEDDIELESESEQETDEFIEKYPVEEPRPVEHTIEIIVVNKDKRRTSNIITKTEMTELVSIRATQISQHNNCMVDLGGFKDPIKLAQRELMLRKCPLVLERCVGERLNLETKKMEKYYEFWQPNEMTFATSYNVI